MASRLRTFLEESLYALPIIGSIKLYREIQKQNGLLNRYIGENPDSEPYLKPRLRSALESALCRELVSDIIYGVGYVGINILKDAPLLPDSISLSSLFGSKIVSPLFVLGPAFISYMIGEPHTNIIREYQRHGTVNILVQKPEIITIQ